ncbi:MAG: aldehyde dehydrogenase family protein, partial [Streptosporangiaceae bacterium]
MTDDAKINDVAERLRRTFDSGRTKPLAWRRGQLQALRKLLVQESEVFLKALEADLGKSPVEAYTTEIGFTLNEIDHTLKHLAGWLRPRKVAVPSSMLPGRAKIVREPLGVTLIIAPWNYPLQLALAPLVGALAAGNCAVVKPSELAPATSAAIARLLPEHLDSEAVEVVEGAVQETTALLAQHFDHIFYTGNGTVGRIVMAAAAKNLTPVALELGGKSPVIVEPGTDLAGAARRIVWGKYLNAGQTCVAPDYVLAIGETADQLEPLLVKAIRSMYGSEPADSQDYGRIVSERHFDRLAAFLPEGRTVVGGGNDRAGRYIAPTVLADLDADSPIMQEEIFGPILPIIRVADL